MDDFLTTVEASALIGVSPEYIRRLASKGRIKSKKLLSTVLIERKSLLRYRADADKYNASKGKYKQTEATK